MVSRGPKALLLPLSSRLLTLTLKVGCCWLVRYYSLTGLLRGIILAAVTDVGPSRLKFPVYPASLRSH